MSTERADPFDLDFDVSGFEPKPSKKPPASREAIRAVSEANNFPSRAPAPKAKSAQAPAPVPEPVMASVPISVQRRRRTGRNVQFNIKATAETIERFVAISDGQGWVFGETLERALAALERELKPRKKADA